MHAHAPGHRRAATWAVTVSLFATLVLVVVEFVAGYRAQSLALISDAWHNLTDVPTMLLAWVALRLEQKPPNRRQTYGYHRAGVLAAFVNALIMLGIAVYISYEGYERLLNPRPVATGTMLVVGVVALLINSGVSLALAREYRDLNLRAVLIHNLGDALSNLGILAGALLIRHTGQDVIDPLVAFLIAGLILWTALGIVMDSVNILLESTPRDVRLEEVAEAMLTVPGVREVHDLHVWSLGSQAKALSCHILTLDMAMSESEKIAFKVRELMARRFGIQHTTLQFEHTHETGEPHFYMPEPWTSKEHR